MSDIMIMKENIFKAYGENSYQAQFAQYIFSKRDTQTFIEVYNKLMGAKNDNQFMCNVFIIHDRDFCKWALPTLAYSINGNDHLYIIQCRTIDH